MPPGADPGPDDQPGPPPSRSLEQRIREIAYLMWEAAGHQHGRALDYWLAAEQEVLATLAATARALAGTEQPPAGGTADEPGGQSPPKDANAG